MEAHERIAAYREIAGEALRIAMTCMEYAKRHGAAAESVERNLVDLRELLSFVSQEERLPS